MLGTCDGRNASSTTYIATRRLITGLHVGVCLTNGAQKLDVRRAIMKLIMQPTLVQWDITTNPSMSRMLV
jgi:hypothetical protein